MIYVIDENGNLFTFIKKKGEGDPVPLNYRFCMNTISNIKPTMNHNMFSPDIFYIKN